MVTYKLVLKSPNNTANNGLKLGKSQIAKMCLFNEMFRNHLHVHLAVASKRLIIA